MKYVIENLINGEIEIVTDKSAYLGDGWKILEEREDDPPYDHVFDKTSKKWVLRKDPALAKERRKSRAQGMPREELVDWIEALEARIQKLENK
jgi:hypothetical protein